MARNRFPKIGGWGFLVRPGNLNGSCVRDSVAWLFIVISPPVAVPHLWSCCCFVLFCETKLNKNLRDDGASLVLPAWVLVGIGKLSFVVRRTFGISLVPSVRLVPRCRWSRWPSFSL
jgi:hypothetical protein